jgi:hypothetical protein
MSSRGAFDVKTGTNNAKDSPKSSKKKKRKGAIEGDVGEGATAYDQ